MRKTASKKKLSLDLHVKVITYLVMYKLLKHSSLYITKYVKNPKPKPKYVTYCLTKTDRSRTRSDSP